MGPSASALGTCPPWTRQRSLCLAVPPAAARPRRPLGTPTAIRARTGASRLLGWPEGAGGSQASKPQCPKGRGCLRPTQGPDLGAGWPQPWQGLASGGRRHLGTGWSVDQSGCCPGSQGHRNLMAQPPGQGVRAGAQSTEVQARLQLGSKSGQSRKPAAARVHPAPGGWTLEPLPEPQEGTP